jgi:hypothetical protein
MSPSQQLLCHLIMGEVEQIPCDCRICKSPCPKATLNTQFKNCARTRRFLQLLRQYSELIDLSSQGPAPSSSPAPLPSVP